VYGWAKKGRRAGAVSEKCRRGRAAGRIPARLKVGHHGAITATENVDRSAGSLAYHAADQ
jgi:hypothetical protein